MKHASETGRIGPMSPELLLTRRDAVAAARAATGQAQALIGPGSMGLDTAAKSSRPPASCKGMRWTG